MSILRKITKKYKFLRFLNFKTTKLAVLTTALLGLCVTSGHSFAKYRSENYGNGAAGTARFGAQLVYFPKTVSTAAIKQGNQLGYYAFVASFHVDFNDCEVKTIYRLSLKLGNGSGATWDNSGTLSRTSFAYNPDIDIKTHPYALIEQENDTYAIDTSTSSVKNLINDSEFTFKNNTPYYAVGVENSGTITYGWEEGTLDNGIFTIANNKEGQLSGRHYYQVLFFTKIELVNSKVSTESVSILYNLYVEQVGA